MQKARRSSIQSTKAYKAFQAFQLQELPQAFQFYKDIPVIPDIPVIHDIPAFQALLHVPVLPVPTTAIQHSPVRIQILHTHWFPLETSLSTSRRQYTTTNLHSSKKGRCCDIGHTALFYRIELRVKLTFSQSRINSSLRLVK